MLYFVQWYRYRTASTFFSCLKPHVLGNEGSSGFLVTISNFLSITLHSVPSFKELGQHDATSICYSPHLSSPAAFYYHSLYEEEWLSPLSPIDRLEIVIQVSVLLSKVYMQLFLRLVKRSMCFPYYTHLILAKCFPFGYLLPMYKRYPEIRP